MIKDARITVQKTPSVVSGQPATRIEGGEPLRDGEVCTDPGLEKMAKIISTPDGTAIINLAAVVRVETD